MRKRLLSRDETAGEQVSSQDFCFDFWLTSLQPLAPVDANKVTPTPIDTTRRPKLSVLTARLRRSLIKRSSTSPESSSPRQSFSSATTPITNQPSLHASPTTPLLQVKRPWRKVRNALKFLTRSRKVRSNVILVVDVY